MKKNQAPTSMAVPQKMISVVVDKLPRREFISVTVFINSKNNPASDYEYYGFFYFSKTKGLYLYIISV